MDTHLLIKEAFFKNFHREPDEFFSTPYRISPLGAHSDHQLGKVTGFAIDKGIKMATSVNNDGSFRAISLQFEGQKEWNLNDIPPIKQGDWADYLRGVTLSLQKRYKLTRGFNASICGELPIGGLSSSATVTLTFLRALAFYNNIELSNEELITIAKEAENQYVGVSCGILDQSCEVYCKENMLLYLDTKDNQYQNIEAPKNATPFEILVVFSGLERSLANSKFNNRVEECHEAARLLSDGKENYLRNVPYETYLKRKDKLPVNNQKRAEHFYTEFKRVELGVEYFRKGDIVSFGKLMFESGDSSINNYESGCPELIRLHEIMKQTEGIYGGRFSGAGFKGCSIALINPKYRDSIIKNIEKLYLESFPHLKGKYQSFTCC